MNQRFLARARGIVCLIILLAAAPGGAHAQSRDAEARSAAAKLPVFAALKALVLRPDASGNFALALKSSDVSASLFSVDGAAGRQWYGAIRHNRPEAFRPKVLAPDFATIAGDMRFRHVVVLVAKARGALPVASVPPDLALGPYAIGGTIQLEAGVNVFLSGVPGRTGLLGVARQSFGFSAPVRMHGAAGPSVASSLFATGGARTRGRDKAGPLALTVKLPGFRPEPFRSLADRSALDVAYKNVVLSIRTHGRDYAISGRHEATITVNRRAIAVKGTIAATRRGREYEITTTGKVATGGAVPPLAGFSLVAIGLEGTLSGPRAQLGIAADVRVPSGSVVSGVASVSIAPDRRGRKRVEEVKLAVNGSMSLADLRIPLPRANEIRFSDLSFGMNVPRREGFIGGTVSWKRVGLKSRGVLFAREDRRRRQGFALFLEMAQTSLKRLVPGLPRGMVDVPIPQGAVVLSTLPMANVPVAELPSPARAIMATITTDSGAVIQVQDGFNILTRLGGPLDGVAKKLGIQGDLVVGGSVGGVVSGKPGFALYADLPRFQVPPQLSGRFMTAKSAKARFFVTAAKNAVHVGIELEAAVRFGRDEPVFAGKMFGTMTPTGASFNFSGKLKGRWRDPMGLRGIEFEDVVVGMGLGASASVDIALGGKLRLGKLRYGMQSFVSLQVSPAAGIPVPKAFGVNLTGNKLGMLTPLEIMDALTGAVAHGPLAAVVPNPKVKRMMQTAAKVSLADAAKKAIPVDLLSLRDFQLYLATPGASHPDMPALDGMGFKLAGKVYLGSTLLGSTDSYLKMPDGLKLDVTTRRFALGPLRLDNARFAVRVPVPGLSRALPSLAIKARGGVKPFRAGIEVEMGARKVSFAAQVKLGPLGSARFAGTSIGPNLLAPRDFSFTVDVRGFDNGFRKQLGGALDKYARNGPAQRAHRAAVKKAATKKAALERARVAARRDMERKTRGITKAQKNVDKLNGEIRAIDKRIRGWKKKLKKAKEFPPNPGNITKYGAKITWGNTKKASLFASLKVAKATLASVKASVKVTGVELDPRVAKARNESTAAHRDAAFLAIAAGGEKGMANFAKLLLRAATKDFRVHRIALVDARLAGALRGHKQKLIVDMTIKGKRFKHTFNIDVRGPWRLDFGDLPKRVASVFKKKNKK